MASVALSVERERRTENVFHMLLIMFILIAEKYRELKPMY